MKFSLFILLLLYVQVCLGQQADSTRLDSTVYEFRLNAMGSLNQTNNNKNYLLNNSGRFSIKGKYVGVNFNAVYVYGQSSTAVTNNDFSTSVDGDFNRRRSKFYYWALANYSKSLSLKINNLVQLGAGVAYNFIENEKNSLNLSEGLIYEYDDLFRGTPEDKYSTIRNSLRLRFKWTIFSSLKLESTNFFQNSLQYGDDYIIRSNTVLSFQLKKWLSITTSVIYNRFSQTDQENLLITYGVRMEGMTKKYR
ncbi:DUF481 domain-containing protein [Pollutibacter soli]|uniref:DUF481 domain-containing protein n=1 Tax=Pollutibacter soli TaxID=3034157 RepID=UPI0030136AD7